MTTGARVYMVFVNENLPTGGQAGPRSYHSTAAGAIAALERCVAFRGATVTPMADAAGALHAVARGEDGGIIGGVQSVQLAD